MASYPFWIEHDENGNPNNYLWVKIDNIPAGQTKTIYVHTDGSNSPDGDSVFEFFDDFNGSSLDTNKWVIDKQDNGAEYSLQDGKLVFNVPRNTAHIILKTKKSFNYSTELHTLRVSNPNSGPKYIHVVDSNNNVIETYHLDTNDCVISTFTNGSISCGTTDVSPRTDDNNWHTITQNFRNDGVGKLFIDGSLKKTISISFSEHNWRIGSNDYSWKSYVQTTKYEYVFIRKCVDNEPSVVVDEIEPKIYKVDITNNETSDLVDYQVAIPLSELSDITSSTQTLDVTHEKPCDVTLFPFWIEHDENNNPINHIWIKLDKLKAGETRTIYLRTDGYFSPNGDDVFILFDDFEDSSLNTSKWTITLGSVSVSGGILTVSSARIRSNTGLISDDFITETRAKVQYDNGKNFEIGPADFGEDSDGKWQTFIVRGYGTSYFWYDDGGKYSPSRSELLTTYKNIKFVKTSSTTSISIGSETESYSWATDPMYYINYYSSTSNPDTIYSDWVFVRKYTANEPSVSVTDKGDYYKITITNNEASELTDYQVAIPLSDISGIDSSNQKLQVSDSPELIYPYWIEHDENGNPINYVWVKVDSIPAGGTKTIYAIKESGFSPNGDNVFEFFDDFEGTSLNTSKWTVEGSPTISVSNSKLDYFSSTSDTSRLYFSIPETTTDSFIVEEYVNYKSSSNKDYYLFGIINPTNLFGGEAEDHSDTYYSYRAGPTWYVSSVSLNDNSWNKLSLKYSNKQFWFFANSQEFGSGSFNYDGSFQNFYVGLDVWSDVQNDFEIDYVFKRKYTANEPSVSVTDKGDYYKITITNNEASELTDYQVAIPINDLDITSTTESIKFTDTSPEQPSESNKSLHFSHNF